MKLKEFLHKTKNFMSLVNVDYPYAKYVILAYGVSTAVVPFLSLVCTAWILNSLIAQDYHSAVTAVWILVVGGGAFSMIQTVTGSKIEVYSRTIDNSISSQVNYKTYVMQYDAYERQGSLDAVRLARQKANGAGGAGSIMIEMPRFADACIETVLCFFFVGKLFYQTGSFSILQDGSFWIVVILLITFLYGGAKISAKSMKVFEDMQKMNVRNNSIGSYILQTGMMISKKKDLQLYDLEDVTLHYLQAMYKSFYEYCEYGIINGRLTGLLAVLMNIFAAAAYIFVGFRAIQGSIAIGDVLLYAGAIQMLAGRAKDIVTAYNAIAFRIDFVDQFYEFIHAPAMHYEGTLPIEKRSDNDYALEFKDVSFCYPGTDTKVLDHINLKFRVGEKLALVGRNGAGKTTIVKLLCRFYEPTEGKILLNGIDIQKYDYAEYTSIFAPVFQDFEMFSLPVEDNVACTDHPDSVQLEEALKTVGMKERVDAMPEGIHTLLYHDNGEGTDISGGEAQKLAIARAWYKDAPFIILDEPTAALDPLAEAEIYENFNELIAGKTAIYISHRMSSCKFCNRIVVLADGKIVEEGTHQKLLAENGQYASLFNAQAEYYRS